MDSTALEDDLRSLLDQHSGDLQSVYLGLNIPADKLRNARTAHGYSEDVFFLYDGTLFGSAKKSILLGRCGLSFKLDDGEPAVHLTWQEIDAISSSGSVLAVQEKGALSLLKLPYATTPLEGIAEGALLRLLQSFAAASQSPWRKSVEAIESTVSAWEQPGGQRPTDTQAATLLGQLHQKLSALGQKPDALPESLTPRTRMADGNIVVMPVEYASLAVLHARALIASGRPEGVEELRRLTTALRKTREAPDEYSAWVEPVLRPALTCALHYLANQSDAPDAKLLLYRMAASEASEASIELRHAALRGMHELDLIAGFGRLRPERRDIILCTTLLPSWPALEFRCTSPEVLRQLPWKFPVGHPIEGEFYARHPLRPDLYLLIDDYHQQLFQDRFGELKELMAALGAVEIELDASEEFGRQMLSAYRTRQNVSDSAVTGATAELETKENEKARADVKRAVHYRLRLSPSRTPHLPSNLVWLPHEPTWQRLASTALSGACQEISVEFRMSDEYAVSRKRLDRMRGELALFGGKIELSLRNETEQFLQEMRQTSWQITARFQPPVGSAAEEAPSHAKPDIDPEAEYAQDVADVCVDGSLSELAYRILARRRQRFGLNTEQAERIEQKVLAEWKLTEAEREFLEDLKDCWSEGAPSEDARRILHRRRTRLGISEEKALELEELIRKSAVSGLR